MIYGSQYYRTPNPPPEDWVRDLQNMKAHGMNTVRLWAMWSWSHTGDGKFDFSELDRLTEICREVGLKALIQVILENAPAWLVLRHPEARYAANDGESIDPMGRPNTPGGGWPGLCLDNEPAAEAATEFMRALAAHFAGHEALLGYDVWNEVWFELDGYIGDQYYCYCPATVEKFRNHLAARYGDLDALSSAWRRRYTCWEEVNPPRYWGGYPDWLDWIKFRLANQGRLLRWRAETLRKTDPQALLVSHGLPNTLGSMATMLTDDWRNAEEVDLYGLSCFPLWFNYDDAETFKVHDLIRAASRGKTFWTAEMQAGPSGEGLMHSRAPGPEDIRLWNWISLASGAKGVMYWQWRPELLGPESPGFGLCHLDGSPGERAEAASWFTGLKKTCPEIETSRPVRGEVAIVVLPESQLFCHVADRSAGKYAQSVKGAYRALSRAGYQVDFAKIDQIEGYRFVYLPFPLMIEEASANALVEYVRNGGKLISEACPAQFGDHGYVQISTPGYGLDDVFGLRAKDGPDTVFDGQPSIVWGDEGVPCVVHRQRIETTTARTVARFSDGGPAITENTFGLGEAIWIGTYAGISYEWGCEAAGGLIADLVQRTGFAPMAQSSDPDVWVRLHTHADGILAFVINMSWDRREVKIDLSKPAGGAVDLVSEETLPATGRRITMDIDARDARLLLLVPAAVEALSV